MKKLLLLAVIATFGSQTAFGLLGGQGGKQSDASRQMMAKRKACQKKGYNWVHNYCVKPGLMGDQAPKNIGGQAGTEHLIGGQAGTRRMLGGQSGTQTAASQQYMARRQACQEKQWNWVQNGVNSGYCVKPGLMGAAAPTV